MGNTYHIIAAVHECIEANTEEPQACFKRADKYLSTKNYEQVRYYYYRLVRKINKLLRPMNIQVDQNNHVDILKSMLNWWTEQPKSSPRRDSTATPPNGKISSAWPKTSGSPAIVTPVPNKARSRHASPTTTVRKSSKGTKGQNTKNNQREKTGSQEGMKHKPSQNKSGPIRMTAEFYPIDDITRTRVRNGGYNPYVELTFNSNKPVTSLLLHLEKKFDSCRIAPLVAINGNPSLAKKDMIEFIAGSLSWNHASCPPDLTASHIHQAVGCPQKFRIMYRFVPAISTGTQAAPFIQAAIAHHSKQENEYMILENYRQQLQKDENNIIPSFPYNETVLGLLHGEDPDIKLANDLDCPSNFLSGPIPLQLEMRNNNPLATGFQGNLLKDSKPQERNKATRRRRRLDSESSRSQWLSSPIFSGIENNLSKQFKDTSMHPHSYITNGQAGQCINQVGNTVIGNDLPRTYFNMDCGSMDDVSAIDAWGGQIDTHRQTECHQSWNCVNPTMQSNKVLQGISSLPNVHLAHEPTCLSQNPDQLASIFP